MLPDGRKELTLSRGEKVIILEGKGKHARIATQMADEQPGSYLGHLMSQLVTINGSPVVMEDLDELPLRDYLFIKVEFQYTNF